MLADDLSLVPIVELRADFRPEAAGVCPYLCALAWGRGSFVVERMRRDGTHPAASFVLAAKVVSNPQAIYPWLPRRKAEIARTGANQVAVA